MDNIVHRTLSNAAWGFISYVWPICFAIFITPIVVSAMGIHVYGIYVFINTILSFLGLLEFGLSTAISKYLAQYIGAQDNDKIRILSGTAMTIFTVIGLIGGSIFMIGAILTHTLPVLQNYSQYSIGLISAGILFLLSAINSLYSIAFTSLQRIDTGSKVGMVFMTVQQISILGLILTGYTINAIFFVLAIIAFFSLLISRRITTRMLPELRVSLSWNLEEFQKYYKFGIITFFNNIATVSLTYLDRLFIPFFLGPSSLTYYSLPGNVTTRIPGISNSLSAILFPMSSSLSGSGDLEMLKRLYVRSFRLITVVSAAVSVTVISFAYDILAFWISPDLARTSEYVLVILAMTNFILALGGPLSNFLLGLGKLRFLTVSSIVMALINLVSLLILLPIAGINGAAWAYLVSVLPIAFMFFYTEKHYLALSERRRYYKRTILGNILVGGTVFIVAHYALRYIIHDLFSLLAMGALSGILYIALYWASGFFEQEDVASMKQFFKKILKLT
ncbi:MAG: polysaccharide biosynthesis C-terminal domain-containing protein [Patescibacteria group bacterium]|nr:polysaccharide biosynthesis C-terminal domain-containing protein [Patescibacteria group bacterium]